MNTAIENIETDQQRLDAFVGKVMEDIGGSFAVLLSFMGDQTGVYRTLRDTGPCNTGELARLSGVDERYLREWLSAQAAAGYVVYHEKDDTFSRTAAQAIVLAQEGHPACLQGFLQLFVSQFTAHEKAVDTFRSGAGRPWGEHHGCCFCGTDRFFRPGYAANLVNAWLPALHGITAKAMVLDAVHRAPGDSPSAKQGDVLTVEFTVLGVTCLGLNGGPAFEHNQAFSFQVATEDQQETDRYWNVIVGNGGQESECGWCKDKWGISWQITPIALTKAYTSPGRAAAKRAFHAMLTMRKIDIAAIEAAFRG